MNPLALLRLVPLKDWIYGGIIVGLLVAFGCYTVHERHVGAAKIEAIDARAVKAQKAHNKEVETRAKTTIDSAAAQYKAAVAAPPARDAPHIVCVNPRRGGHVSGNAGDRPRVDAGTSVPEESTVDPGPALDTVGRDADAQVKALQAYVTACQAAGVCAK